MSLKELSIEQRLTNIETLLTSQKEVLTFEEACNYAGVTKSHMYKLTSSGGVPCYKPQGKMIYFDKKELETWLLRNRLTTSEEIDEKASTYVTLNKRGGSK